MGEDDENAGPDGGIDEGQVVIGPDGKARICHSHPLKDEYNMDVTFPVTGSDGTTTEVQVYVRWCLDEVLRAGESREVLDSWGWVPAS